MGFPRTVPGDAGLVLVVRFLERAILHPLQSGARFISAAASSLSWLEPISKGRVNPCEFQSCFEAF